jgi:hypothetical protein
MIRILLYVTASRPYILQEVGLVAQFQGAAKETHVQAIKRIFKYLKGTLDFDLWYSRGEYFTLPIETFEYLKQKLGVISLSSHQ